ncbi:MULTISPECIES: alpha/beta hydrolase [unclassified Pusillimonas]|uniref:alpha/beta hydrolase n=1 Tax=unclassified Pusillimonas TaxID=2640016 RepID=UPI000B9C9DF0|nr:MULTISPECIES: alpha/beta hydrolase [unclassified Pusillimonas]OXR50736.1 carboxylesterase [Pusillimonas sp. T2]ROT44794.1 carboxylesterase [Pusillimonas sp. NJUB218]
MTTLETLEIETAPNPTHAVIWMHGLGADGNDFAPIVPELGLGSSPAIRFIFPHAPVQPVTINNGMHMRAWYDILSMDIGGRREDETGLRASQAAIEALIARENSRGIPTQNIVLAGFSQGCAMTLQTGLRHAEPLAGLVCLSGYLPLADTLANERHTANANIPVFMAHGTQDPVVAIERAQASHDAMTALGYGITWKTYPMPHSVCLEEIRDISAFLKQVLV